MKVIEVRLELPESKAEATLGAKLKGSMDIADLACKLPDVWAEALGWSLLAAYPGLLARALGIKEGQAIPASDEYIEAARVFHPRLEVVDPEEYYHASKQDGEQDGEKATEQDGRQQDSSQQDASGQSASRQDDCGA